MKLGGKLQGK